MLQRILSNFLMGIYLLFMLFIGLLMPVVFYFATIKGGVLLFDGHGFMETWGFLGGIVLVMLITIAIGAPILAFLATVAPLYPFYLYCDDQGFSLLYILFFACGTLSLLINAYTISQKASQNRTNRINTIELRRRR